MDVLVLGGCPVVCRESGKRCERTGELPICEPKGRLEDEEDRLYSRGRDKQEDANPDIAATTRTKRAAAYDGYAKLEPKCLKPLTGHNSGSRPSPEELRVPMDRKFYVDSHGNLQKAKESQEV